MLKSITWPQVAVVGMMLAFAFAAHKYLGQDAGMAVGAATTLVAFMLGRPRDGAS
jgi:hypothetical protein